MNNKKEKIFYNEIKLSDSLKERSQLIKLLCDKTILLRVYTKFRRGELLENQKDTNFYFLEYPDTEKTIPLSKIKGLMIENSDEEFTKELREKNFIY